MKSLAELAAIKNKMKQDTIIRKEGDSSIKIVVGMATCGIAAGARPVFDAFKSGLEKQNITNAVTAQTGCIGRCTYEPLVDVYVPGEEPVTYVFMTAEKVEKVISSHIKGGVPVTEYTVGAHEQSSNLRKTDFFKKQQRVAMRLCGTIDPEQIDEYIGFGGYEALGKVLTEMKPEEVIEEVKKSGLRGRGGAGFPTGMKWDFAAKAKGDVKYVCCNADEGDPGAFMDRALIEGDPHSILEAMAIAGYAIGSHQGFIYIRAEYPLAVKRLEIAIEQAKAYGLFGKNIFDSGFDFDIEIRLGAGAFVCGEETALMTSIEGKRGEPRPRPPFPAIKGLFESPTILNNVETYSLVPQIITKGSDWFGSMGTEKCKGTKVFALGGNVTNVGLVEVPMGTTLREIVEDIGGGVPDGKKFKAAQTGGPSGGCIPEEHYDVPIDYEKLTEIGSMMGSGGLIVMDEDQCMVDIAKFFLGFTVDESCGKCTPCRIGTKRLLETLDKITAGKGEMIDLEKLEDLCSHIKAASLCGLGQTAPNPVLSTIRYFEHEYLAHIQDKKCLTGVCKALVTYSIIEEKCIGCTICAKNCPAEAITGAVKTPHVIDPAKCIKCDVCFQKCKFDAIAKN